MTPDPDLIAPALRLAESGAVRALFLAGSHGAGTADAFSDLDLVALCPAARQPAAAAAWRAALDAEGPVFWAERRGPGSLLLNTVTADYRRVDLFLVESLAGRARDGLRPLHDPEALLGALPAGAPAAAPDPERIRRLTEEFLRVLGLLPVALGREEHALAARGAAILQGALMDLMLEGHAHRGGMLHPSRVLDADEIAALDALPPIHADRAALIAAHRALAAAMLPRARRLYARGGLDWPEAFEAAVRGHLARAGIALD